MIPERLELTNFFSYRDTAVLDFDGIHVAGVSGPNGAGKSSIMEAITWSLFGRSRARSDDDLVNRQAGESGLAEVRFNFSLEGVSYRVIRGKQVGKPLILELQMAAANGDWKTLSEGKIRETQAAIEALLRMNYDTFINASFLLQGKADEFTTRTPSQRKEILAELLGVTVWEAYREQAAAARKEVDGQINLLDARLADIALELQEEPQRRSDVEAAQARHDTVVERRGLKELLLNETRLKEEARRQQRQQVADSEARSKRMSAQLEQARQTLLGREERRAALAGTVKRAAEIAADFAAWQKADGQVRAQQELAARHHALARAMQPLELEIAQAASRLEQELQTLQTTAEHVPETATEVEALGERIAADESQLADLQEQNERLTEVQEALQKERDTLQQATGERRLMKQELAQLESQSARMDELAKEKSSFDEVVSQAQASIAELDDQISVIQEQQQAFSQLQAEVQALTAQQPALRQRARDLKDRLDALESAEAGGDCPLCSQPLSEEHRQIALDNTRREGTDYADSFRANKARLKALEVEIPQVEKTIKQGPPLERERQAQQKRLAQAEARMAEIEHALAEWAAGGEKRLVEVAASLADRGPLDAQTARVSELEQELAAMAALQQQIQAQQAKLAANRARLAETRRTLEEWESNGKLRLAEVKAQLDEQQYAVEAQEQLADFQQQLSEVGYDEAAHQAAVQAAEKLSDAPAQHQALKEAQAALQPLLDAIDDIEKQIAQQETDLEEQERQLVEARKQLELLETEGVDLKTLEKEVFQLREEEIVAAQQVGRAQQRLEVLDNQRSMREELLDHREGLSLRAQRLALLEKSCGRKGVQALLIEHALPEIEEGANELLDRLTGGEMRIKFDTQRQLKSRDAIAETLDIIISDRAGERPYDNYSGGEQFRINFAIRLALSQLLAKRAGAKLQTLVVDEGFGSQDPQGRQRLIEAINAVQDDFACVLIITHIDELREAFPTRIEVSKEANGSQITVQ